MHAKECGWVYFRFCFFVWAVETQPMATAPVRVSRTGENLKYTHVGFFVWIWEVILPGRKFYCASWQLRSNAYVARGLTAGYRMAANVENRIGK